MRKMGGTLFQDFSDGMRNTTTNVRHLNLALFRIIQILRKNLSPNIKVQKATEMNDD